MNTHKCVAARFSETLGSMAVTGDHAPASFPRCAHPCPASCPRSACGAAARASHRANAGIRHINIPPVLFVSAFSIQEAALPCKDAGPQKKQGRLTSQQAAPHGINTPLFYGGKPGKDTACRLPYPLLIPEYILHVRGVNAPCFICSEKCYPRGMAT